MKGKKLGGLLPLGGEGGPEATVVSDEDEAAEMEDEAVRSRVQHKPKVRGEVVGGGQPWGPPPSSPPITWWDVCLVLVLCGCHSDPLPPSLCLFTSLCVSGFLALSVPTCPNL